MLYVDIRYGDGVLTPYAPMDARPSAGGAPEPFIRGNYAVRIRTRPIGDC